MTEFGRYQVVRALAQGTAARTFLCRDDAHLVVVKLRTSAADPNLESTAHARFLAERDLLVELRHPNIVPLLDAGSTAEGAPYFVMPFLETGLAEVLRPHELASEPRVPHATAVALLRDVLAALAHVHARGVVHRDVRPANLRLSSEGRAIVCDFGAARTPGAPALGERALGVRPFASPEQLVAAEAADARADVHAVGVLAHLLFTGYLPGPAAVTSGALHRRVGHALGDWVAAAMSSARERRPANASDMLAGLNQATGA